MRVGGERGLYNGTRWEDEMRWSDTEGGRWMKLKGKKMKERKGERERE